MTSKMIVIGPHPPMRGGIAEVNQEMCTLLSAHNTVHGIAFSRIYPQFFFNQKKMSEKPLHSKYSVEFTLDAINPFSWERVATKILQEKPDTVLFHWWTTYLFPCYLYLQFRLKGKIKMGALIHNAVPHGVKV